MIVVGFDPESRILVARSGDVMASVGLSGPTVIVDDEAVVPVLVPPGNPSGGSDLGVAPDPSDGVPNDSDFAG